MPAAVSNVVDAVTGGRGSTIDTSSLVPLVLISSCSAAVLSSGNNGSSAPGVVDLSGVVDLCGTGEGKSGSLYPIVAGVWYRPT